MYSPHCQCGGDHWWCGVCDEENCRNKDGAFCWWCGTERRDSKAGRTIRETERRERERHGA